MRAGAIAETILSLMSHTDLQTFVSDAPQTATQAKKASGSRSCRTLANVSYANRANYMRFTKRPSRVSICSTSPMFTYIGT